ncbi:MAG TPA: arylamine N-acetyltransferase [Candidatus Acidoferrum sp.]|nr:arylamine N-acetyltransferase [Candidatus Acidoferrum sp.]
MGEALDLDAYFGRIGYSGARAPTLETLRAIHLRHALTIPFENLDPFLRRPVRLDLASLQGKLVRDRRGGYCFEHNLLFKAALDALGFQVTGLAARVMWNLPEGVTLPRTHMLLRIALDGQDYLADVGFGGQTLTAPIKLIADIEQATPHEPFRLLRAGDGVFLKQAKLGGAWKPLHRFDLQPQLPPDYEVANWYVSTHPESRFVKNLTVAMPAPGRRYALFNRDFTVHHLDGPSEQRRLSGAREIRGVLEEVFGLTMPADPELDAALERLQ